MIENQIILNKIDNSSLERHKTQTSFGLLKTNLYNPRNMFHNIDNILQI